MQAIETYYKGYRFRSRLEARWAVFFDAMQIEWEYEKEGFVLDDGTLYLPDFYLTEEKIWVEVKPCELTDLEKAKTGGLAMYYPVVEAIGIPEWKAYYMYEWLEVGNALWEKCTQYGLLQGVLDESGTTLEDLPCLICTDYVFGVSRANKYLLQAMPYTKRVLPLGSKWKQALIKACDLAKRVRFEYGEGL